MENQAAQLKDRTKRFAVQVITMFRALPRTDEARILGRQLLRAATSVAANYRAVCRARSRAEFVAKLGVVVEEADETVFGLEVLVESGVIHNGLAEALTCEANELLAIFAASHHTAKVAGPSGKMDK